MTACNYRMKYLSTACVQYLSLFFLHPGIRANYLEKCILKSSFPEVGVWLPLILIVQYRYCIYAGEMKNLVFITLK